MNSIYHMHKNDLIYVYIDTSTICFYLNFIYLFTSSILFFYFLFLHHNTIFYAMVQLYFKHFGYGTTFLLKLFLKKIKNKNPSIFDGFYTLLPHIQNPIFYPLNLLTSTFCPQLQPSYKIIKEINLLNILV